MKSLTFSLIAALGVAALGAPFALAQDAAPTSTNLISNGDFAKDGEGWVYHYLGTQNPDPVFIDAAPTDKITRALQATVTPESAPTVLKTYSMTMRQTFGRAVKAGETFKASFWARSPESSTLAIIFGTLEKDKRGFLFKRITVSPDWKQYEVTTTSKEDMALGNPTLEFHLALQPGTLELTGVEVTAESDATP